MPSIYIQKKGLCTFYHLKKIITIIYNLHKKLFALVLNNIKNQAIITFFRAFRNETEMA